jgi:predicted acylesterase/phospholipase RssA
MQIYQTFEFFYLFPDGSTLNNLPYGYAVNQNDCISVICTASDPGDLSARKWSLWRSRDHLPALHKTIIC